MRPHPSWRSGPLRGVPGRESRGSLWGRSTKKYPGSVLRVCYLQARGSQAIRSSFFREASPGWGGHLKGVQGGSPGPPLGAGTVLKPHYLCRAAWRAPGPNASQFCRTPGGQGPGPACGGNWGPVGNRYVRPRPGIAHGGDGWPLLGTRQLDMPKGLPGQSGCGGREAGPRRPAALPRAGLWAWLC